MMIKKKEDGKPNEKTACGFDKFSLFFPAL